MPCENSVVLSAEGRWRCRAARRVFRLLLRPSMAVCQCTRPRRTRLSAIMAPTKASSPPGHTISAAVPVRKQRQPHCRAYVHGQPLPCMIREAEQSLPAVRRRGPRLHEERPETGDPPACAVRGFRPACSMDSKNGGLHMQNAKLSPGRMAGFTMPAGNAALPGMSAARTGSARLPAAILPRASRTCGPQHSHMLPERQAAAAHYADVQEPNDGRI